MGARHLDIIDDPARARAALQPIRLRLLHLLERPQSAPQVAKAMGMPRQRVLYHLRTLEAQSGNKKITAEILGISRRSLYNKLAEYGIDSRRRAT